MDWSTLVILIINNGLPLALKLYDKWGNKDVVTPEEIAELRALAGHTPQTQMRDAILRAGIDPNSPKAAELMALVGQPTPPTPPTP